MKIIHLISGGDTGGAKTHILSLLRGVGRDAEVDLVCFMRGEFSEEAESLGISTTVMCGGLLKTLLRLRRMIKDGGYDLIHSHGSRGNFMAALLKPLTGLPAVSTVHSDYRLDYMGRPAARLTYGLLNTLSLRTLNYYAGVSEPMRQLLIERGFKPNSVFTIYNGVDFSKAPPETDRLAYLRSLGLNADGGSVVVGAAARLSPVKDLPTLIRGFALAKAERPELRLVLAGDGPEKERLRELARELGVESSVCFAGWLDDVRYLNASIDINALTSLSETFPYALTEGALSRLPTVASRVGGIPVLIKDGETGLLFEAGDAEALGRCFARLAADPALRKRLGDALYDKAAAEFSLEVTCARQLEIYREILAREERRKTGGRDGVVICGAYGCGNAGDDAILEAIVRALRGVKKDMELTVMARHPRLTARRYGIDAVHTFNIPGFLRRMKRAKLYLNGGGSLIQDVTSRRSLFFYLYTLRAAKKRGCRVLMYGCGIGPVNYPADRRLAARVINGSVDMITLREDSSLTELRDMGVTEPEIILASDPALTLPRASDAAVDAELRRLGMEPGGKYLGFALRKWPDFEAKAPCFAAAARYAREKYGLTPVFLSINHRSDGEAADIAAREAGGPCFILREPMGSDMTIGIMSRMTAIVSMRLHGLIFAAGQGVPLVGVSYDPKVTAFLAYIGQELCAELSGLTEEALCSMLDRAVALSADRERLAASAARLRDIEHRNIDAAKALLLS